jgi:cytochrome P450/ferredoxin-NADP reductase
VTLADDVTIEQLDRDPYPAYAALRREQPVAWIPWAHAFFITRWDDVRALAADPETFSAAVHDSPLTATIGPNLLHSDGACHAQIRAPLTENLRPAAIARNIRAIVESLADKLVDTLEEGSEIDLVPQFAQPLAIRVLTEVTGLPPVDSEILVRWLDGIAAGAANYERDPAKSRLAELAGAEIDTTLARQIHAGAPDGSIIAALRHTPVDGRPMDFSQISATVKLLIIGGMQEPRDLFGFAIGAYLQRPDIRDRIGQSPDAAAQLIEESLRWGSPVGTVTRKTTRPVTLAGVELPAGAVLAGVISSANRDERHWDHPDDFNIDRGDFQHLAFNTGVHACVGATLARTQARLALQALTRRFPGLEAVGPVKTRGWEFRGPVSIPVRLLRNRRRPALPPRPTRIDRPFRPLRVSAATMIAADVRLLSLTALDGEPLPVYQPGSHIDIAVPLPASPAPGGLRLRQYSLTGEPGTAGQWQIAVRKQPGGRGGSLWLHESAKVGDLLEVGRPRNNFGLVDAPAYLFIAGGIGITPMVPLIAEVTRAGRPWHLHYVGRATQSMPFLRQLASPHTRIWTTSIHGRPDLDALVEPAPPGSAVYCCGPTELIDDIEARHVRGEGPWAGLSLHVERFAPRAALGPGTGSGKSFDVYLQRTGVTIRVEPGRTVLSALQDAGILIPSTCREGTCGSCETAVLAGEIEHRDSVLSVHERARGQSMMVCVSRARSGRLVLDV